MPFPLGFNTYSVRAMRWHDLRLLEYAAGFKLDAVFLQDSLDPARNEPAHWKELKDTAARLGIELLARISHSGLGEKPFFMA